MNTVREKMMIPVMMVGAFLGSLSQNMLASALSTILAEFQVSALVGQWLTTIYLLILGVITVLTAVLFQRVRTRVLLETSLLLFAVGCFMALFAPSFWFLLLSRAIQACGAGVLIPVLQMVLIHLYPAEKQGQALGLSGIVIGFAPAVGPSVSGLLIDSFGWRSLFLFLLVATLLVVVAGFFTFRQVGDPKRPPLLLGSALFYGVGFTLFMVAVTQFGNSGVPLAVSLSLSAAGIVVLGVFIRTQLRDAEPLLHLSLFKNHSMQTGTTLMVITYTVMTSGTILVPLYVQSICGLSATLSGLSMLPGSLLLAALSPIAGRLTDRMGIQKVVIAGLIFLLFGTGGYALVSANSPLIVTTCIYSIRSVGLAFLLMPLTAYAVNGLSLDEADHGMAILNSLRQICGSLFSTLLTLAATALSAGRDLDLTGFRAAGLISAAIVLVSLILWILPKHTHK